MSWSRDEFLAISKSPLAKQLFSDPDIDKTFHCMNEMNRAALLHANGITADTSYETALGLLQLVAAFTQKDAHRIKELIEKGISVGARLDYLLPLYDEAHHCGEDIFVASTKYLLGGTAEDSVKLNTNHMRHPKSWYTIEEIKFVTNYVDNATQIRELLRHAKNKSLVLPTPAAVDYMLKHANEYRDSNNNPVIVFIPGALSLPYHSTSQLIATALKNGANINDVGLFGVPGIVWSIIIGDIDATQYFMQQGAKLNLVDDMGNQHVLTWAATSCLAARDDAALTQRMLKLIEMISDKTAVIDMTKPNHRGLSAIDFLKQVDREHTATSTYTP